MEERIALNEGNQKLLWCPFAEITKTRIPTYGKYKKGYPEGVVIHFTAGRSLRGDKDALNTVEHLAQSGYPCIVISNTGNIFQSFPLNQWGPHTGTEHHKSLLGIEVCCAGKLTKVDDKTYKSWFNEKYTSDLVRYMKAKDNIQEGYYHKFTKEQEDSLMNFICWLKFNNPDTFDFDKIYGHDQLAPSRKNDPGASLSSSISVYRELVKKTYPTLY